MMSAIDISRDTQKPLSHRVRLLILTQIVDEADPVLSFFVGWVKEIALHYDEVRVICLREGRHSLPPHVHVLSLGKESGQSRLKYISRLFRYIWQERSVYDAVFVHQNQEYPLIAGWLWMLLKKPVFLWRNHYKGNVLTNIAALFCKKIFYTSRFSYTAKFKQAIQMPVGIDTALFSPDANINKKRRSILFLARIAPSKRAHVLLEALGILYEKHVPFSAAIYGSSLPENDAYYNRLKQGVRTAGLAQYIEFHNGVPHEKVRDVFNRYDVFVNLSKSGMLDKTIFEAAASGCVVLALSKDLKEKIDSRCFVKSAHAEDIAHAIRVLLELTEMERREISDKLRNFVASEHSLRRLGERLVEELR